MASNKMRVASYRAKLKQDSEKWTQYLEKQNATARGYRADNSSNMMLKQLKQNANMNVDVSSKQKLVVVQRMIIFRLHCLFLNEITMIIPCIAWSHKFCSIYV